jgi:hypothetical protein
MTIPEVQKARVETEKQITALVAAFEQATSCIVHSLPVHPATTAGVPVSVEVKVQIP